MNWKKEIEHVHSNEALDSEKALNKYKEFILSPQTPDDIKEDAIHKLAQLLVKLGRANQLSELLNTIRPFFDKISKPKTDRIVRAFIDYALRMPGNEPILISFCKENIEWCKQTNRGYLRQRLETRLYSLMFDVKDYNNALVGLSSLLSEIKKLDDKPLLVEIQLIESRIQHALKNIPKARAALTSARTNANTIYCPPKLQGEIDMQSGILHSEEKDYKTAYSYFYESFETYDTLDDPIAFKALKYMLLCKIMTNQTDDVFALINGKIGLKYVGKEVEAMKAVAKSHANRSLLAFEETLNQYPQELKNDAIIHNHLNELYNKLLEQNLCRIIEPFSRVEISHIADLLKLPVQTVEKKLSLMILDKKYHGILDQGTGTLIVFDEAKQNKLYNTSLDTISSLDRVVGSLYEKTNKLS
ncbi:26S proteasome non-ATPase regulatory subunit 11 [Heterostelium album PN500]|uniref:26S proteasome non-ATPase regulatory subunit 11 n=1 Tax=Heterostelium pallidum (strain ATCC 26659 / Pp 5 / PN500) TaxID=670386 RepID=D3BQJ7_HETP5|nr:26S proteasome non-ATPase regulatory subunit 11 [Heterostelium album PN500]EFA76417.1 26S proteasome non-ATPase regulatory subunit 11 [Heterostelium album PN500]|eukprot:XP_020428549.1 26S proteasome non-ATPase regulatory subunit 11 [Heterostelium album PN500]